MFEVVLTGGIPPGVEVRKVPPGFTVHSRSFPLFLYVGQELSLLFLGMGVC